MLQFIKIRDIADNHLFNAVLLFTVIGEFLLPCILERYYPEYNGKTMVMSALGTVLLNFPLYCPKCKQETLIEAKKFQVTVIEDIDKKRGDKAE